MSRIRTKTSEKSLVMDMPMNIVFIFSTSDIIVNIDEQFVYYYSHIRP